MLYLQNKLKPINMKNIEMILIESNKRTLTDELSCMLLRTNRMTKEETLMSLIMSELDNDGTCKMIQASKDRLCSLAKITIGTYHAYIYKWRAKGILITSDEYITFKTYVTNKTRYLTINPNGSRLVKSIAEVV